MSSCRKGQRVRGWAIETGAIEANYMNKKIRQQKKPNVEFIKAFEQMPANVEKGKQGGSW